MKYELIFKDKKIKNVVSKSEDKIKNYITENFGKIYSFKKLNEEIIDDDGKFDNLKEMMIEEIKDGNNDLFYDVFEEILLLTNDDIIQEYVRQLLKEMGELEDFDKTDDDKEGYNVILTNLVKFNRVDHAKVVSELLNGYLPQSSVDVILSNYRDTLDDKFLGENKK